MRAQPRAIEAFFVLEERHATSGDGVGVRVAQAHADFLKAYGLRADDVPLLVLDPSDWESPFSEFQPGSRLEWRESCRCHDRVVPSNFSPSF